MKKIFMLATAALLISGTSFAQEKKCEKKGCKNGGSCCKDKAKTAKKESTAKI